MLLLLLWLPFLGFITGTIFGRFLGKGTIFFTTINIFCTFVIAFTLIFQQLNQNYIYYLYINKWIYVNSLTIAWELYLDNVNIILCCVVTLISTIVHLYSSEYMQKDPHIQRFMSYLSLFTFFMLILITSNNFVQMFIGWEGVGLASYLLINFWFTRIQANKAAIKAMLFNRMADLLLLLALFSIFLIFETLDYTVVFYLTELFKETLFCIGLLKVKALDIICFFLFLGAMGKSAQIGFHNWLPDAMEGPTPVSALIHAATMVTAGVFLLIRCSPLFELSHSALMFISIIGALTAIFGSSISLFVNDLKKVIAFSTCSQLGYMMIACGIGQYGTALFHLTTHAFFKALLFLAAGSIIHAAFDEQDIRKLGGFLKYLPLTYSCFLIGSLNLTGFPFLSGFYTKDIILEQTYATYTQIGWFCYTLGLIAAFFTAAYSTRLLFLIFFTHPNSSIHFLYLTCENAKQIKTSLICLTFFSIFIGGFLVEIFYGFGTTFFSHAILYNRNTYNIGDIEFINIIIKILPILAVISGISIILYYYISIKFIQLKKNKFLLNLYIFFNKKWFLDRSINQIIITFFFNWALFYSYFSLDRGFLEILGPTSITKTIQILSFIQLKFYLKQNLKNIYINSCY